MPGSVNVSAERRSQSELSAHEAAFRSEIREFLESELPRPDRYGTALFGDIGYMVFSPEFSKKLAARGWLGMSIPPEFGGNGRGYLDRFIMNEELLAAGAPLLAHWVADRQTAPILLAFGTDEQRERFLPRIVAGEWYVGLGFSEPDAGSDLASVKTRATKDDGGWLLNGTKTWTSGAHTNHHFTVLCRTSEFEGDKHNGLSLMLVDLHAPGVQIRPILYPDGGHRINEVFLDDVFVPDDMVIGAPGAGWHVINSELSHERAGPERFMAVWPLFESYFAMSRKNIDENSELIGRMGSRFWALRQLAVEVARGLDNDNTSPISVSVLKDLGTLHEQEVVADLQTIIQDDPDPKSAQVFDALFARAMVMAPSWTLTGGTTEVLRVVAARGLRDPLASRSGRINAADAGPLEEMLNDLFTAKNAPAARQHAETTGWADSCWDAVTAGGLQWIGVSEAIGGSGGSLEDAAVLVRLVGEHAVGLPLAECTMLGGWLLDEAGLSLPEGPVSVPAATGFSGLTLDASNRVSGSVERVPWGARAQKVIALIERADGAVVVALDPARATIEPGRNVAGEPRDRLVFDRCPVSSDDMAVVTGDVVREYELRGALSRALLIGGACQGIADMTVSYANQRKQFNREIIRFQAVSERLVQLVSEAELAALAATTAARRLSERGPGAAFEVGAAKATAARASSAVSAHAHQIHGAIGMTQEYPLHHLTRRLWAWRQEWGTEQYWSKRVGQQMIDSPIDQLFPLLTAGSINRP